MMVRIAANAAGILGVLLALWGAAHIFVNLIESRRMAAPFDLDMLTLGAGVLGVGLSVCFAALYFLRRS
jgi:hypothetical protein